MVAAAVVLAAVLGGGLAAQAHIGAGCGGHEHVNKRNPGGPLKTYTKRQVTDEANAAQSTDPEYECTAYSYQPVLDVKNNYPTIWNTAYLVSGDTTAASIFATVNASVNSLVPDVQPRGTSAGDWSGVNYNASDPACWWTWQGCDKPKHAGVNADITTVPEPNTWGLGFDDGPNCSHNALYDMLYENNQKATMFYIGSNVMDWPLQAIRAIDDGHEICVHTWSHQYMTSFTNDVAFAELYYARQAIKDIIGVTPKCWRPPYGDVDDRIRAIAQGLNLTTIVWNEDSEDWRIGTNNVTSEDIDANYQGFIQQAQNGTYSTYGPVILNHELNNFTMAEMVKFYSQIKSAYKAVVPIQGAYNITQPYAETNYTYPDFAAYVSGSTNITSSAAASASSGSATASGAAASGSAKSSGTATGNSNAAAASSSKSAAGLRQEAGGVLGGLMGLIGLWAVL